MWWQQRVFLCSVLQGNIPTILLDKLKLSFFSCSLCYRKMNNCLRDNRKRSQIYKALVCISECGILD